MEQGTHGELLKNEDGIYSGLVRAQNIEMGVETARLDENEFEKEELKLIKTKSLAGNGEAAASDGIMTKEGLVIGYKRRGFMRSFGLLLYEQRYLWPYYCLTLLCCCAAGAVFPLQS